MMKSKYVIIICLLFLFTLCFYVESNAKDKHEDIIKLKEVYLKVVDKKYIGTSNIGYTSYGFTKNSLVISSDKGKYAILPLKNIKELDKTKSSYDIFKPGANPNVSSIIPIPFDSCFFMVYQDKLMMLNKILYEIIEDNISDYNNTGSKIKLLFLDDNGYIDKETIKYISSPSKYFKNAFDKYFLYSLKNWGFSYDAEIYYLEYNGQIPRLVYGKHRESWGILDPCGFLITGDNNILLTGEYNDCGNPNYSLEAPYSMSPDITKFAMVDDKYNKIRLYTFDNKSIKTNVLTDIKAESNKTRLFLHNNGYLHVIRLGFFTTTSEVYKINDFSKPDGYIYAGINTPLTYYGLYEDAKYHRSYNLTDYFKIEDNTVYRIFKEDSLSEVYDIAISYDMTVAFKAVCRKDSYSCDMYLYSLEPVDANEKGVENQNK